MDKYRVTLTAEERADLEQLVSVGKAAARKLTHARILLLADDSPRAGARRRARSSPPWASACGPSPASASTWSPRGSTSPSTAGRSRPGRTRSRSRGMSSSSLIQLACSDPPEGRCHWTLQLLADELVVLGLVDSVSTETVRQALKKTTSSPGSSRPGASRPRPTPSTSGGWKT